MITMPEHQGLIIGLLLAYGREEILREYTRTSCIASVRLSCDVLGYFGIEARALKVEVAAYNAPAWRRCQRLGRWPEEGELESWSQADGSWGLGIGLPGDYSPTSWPGHLVAVVGRKMIDLALDQADRPQFGMVFTPLALNASDLMLAGARPGLFPYRGGALIYTADPVDRSFETSSNWSGDHSPQTTGTTARVVARMTRALRVLAERPR